MIFYKAYLHDYPPMAFIFDIFILVALYLWQLVRLFVGAKGNKLETSSTTFLFIIMSLLAVTGNVFFFRFQTFVLGFDYYLNLFVVAIAVLEMMLASFAAIEFKSLENSQ